MHSNTAQIIIINALNNAIFTPKKIIEETHGKS